MSCQIVGSRFKKNAQAVFLSLLLTISAGLSTSAAPSVKALDTLKLKQSAVSIGAADVFLTKEAIRVNFGSEKIYLVASAPTWKVVIFNAATKKGIASSYDAFIKHQPRWNYTADVDWVPKEQLLMVGHPVINGRKSTEFIFAEAGKRGLVPKSGGQNGHLIVADENRFDEHVLHILQRTLDLPQSSGLPLSLTLRSEQHKVEGMRFGQGGDQHLVKTVAIASITCTPAYFVYPKTFSACQRESEVLLDAKVLNSNAEQFLETFK